MIQRGARRPPQGPGEAFRRGATEAAYPQPFSSTPQAASSSGYNSDASVQKLIRFFTDKGLAALKEEDAREAWYADWLAYQAAHRLYASVLSSKQYSGIGSEFDLLRFTRFLEVFAYFSPAHAYSLQVSYLGLFAILMGSNDALKREAVAALEAGGVLAFGVSEKQHGSDLLGNEFTLRSNGDGHFVAAGSKYYIGNANAASIIAVLAGKQDGQTGRATNADGARRTPPVLFALRPGASPAVGEARKIRTLGVRAAFVGAFDVAGHEVPERDVIAEGHDAWHAVIGTVTLGRFFLGFGSIGICEHAMAEAVEHVSRRTLYRRPVIDLPHIRTAMSRAYTRLAAMKLYAYRALDYVHAASATDRRYLLFTAVQKAKVSTDGVKVMALISECVGARGFEADTYIEMALRDIQLIPGLEGSTHLNLKLCTQFLDRYLGGSDPAALPPRSLGAGQESPRENPYLMNGSTAARGTVAFAGFLDAYQPLRKVANIRLFARQAAAFRRCVDRGMVDRAGANDVEVTLLVGQCLATIAYAQLIAESVTLLGTATPMVSALFDLLVGDLAASALALASLPQVGATDRRLLRGMVAVPQTAAADWAFAAGRMLAAFSDPTPGPSSR